MEIVSRGKIKLFRSLFRGRTDVYARFWTNFATKKSGYAPVYRLNRMGEALTDQAIASHLSGKEAIGMYPLLTDNTTFFLAIDFDKNDWLASANQLIGAAHARNLPCYLERSKSGNGGHVWFFFTGNLPAFKARRLGKYLLQEANIATRKTFDRMFPNQDEHSGKGLGNLIALPFQGKYLKQGNTAFINEKGKIYPDQWVYLQSFQKITETQIDKILGKSTIEAKLILSNQIFIPETFLPDKLYKFLKSRLNFPNPQYYELERLGYSTWKTPQFIKTLEITENGILIPAGFLENIKQFAESADVTLSIENQQVIAKPIRFPTKLKLKPEQQKIARELLKQDRVVLEAKPGFGKTMVALYCMKRRKQPTLIIVHTRPLLHQWQKKIKEWFEVKEKDLGIIGEGKWQIGEKVTVASYQTLVRRGTEDIKSLFGFVIVDECHHVPARTLTEVVKQLPAKYVLGLTATAFRKDKLERLMNFYVGPISQVPRRIDVSKPKEEKPVTTTLFTKHTNFQADKDIIGDFHEIAKELIIDHNRNQLIVRDLVKALEIGAKCLVLTERVEHCQILLKEVRKHIKGIHAAAVSGRITRKKRAQLAERLKQERFQLLIATGKLMGEGFDWPELTHLFLAFPFSWKGKLIQYIGRVQRSAEGKKEAYIFDYLDYDVPILRIMWFRRLRTYRKLNLRREKIARGKPKVADNQLALLENLD